MWRSAIERADSRQLRALLSQATPENLEGNRAIVRAEVAVAPMIEGRRAAIESLLGQVAGRAIALEIKSPEVEMATASGETSGDGDSAATPPPEAEAAPGGEDHPLVRRAAELFKAKVVHVEPLRRPQ